MSSRTLIEALDILKKTDRIKSKWLPGMLFVDSLGRLARRTGFTPPEATLVGHRTMEASQAGPVLTDPATLGCLLAILREATRDPHIYIVRYYYNETDPDDERMGWMLMMSEEVDWAIDVQDSEGELLSAALIAVSCVAEP